MEGAIYDKGKKNQIVVLDNVDFGKGSTDILSTIPQPAFFQIVEVKYVSDTSRESKYLKYVLRNEDNEIEIMADNDGWWLVDVNAWAKKTTNMHKREILEKERIILKLTHQLEILKEILCQHEIRFVTEKQAKELGLVNKINKDKEWEEPIPLKKDS